MKRFYLICCLAMAFWLAGAVPLSAGIGPIIKINGQTRTYEPPCQIVAGRTMIPIRYVIEDPALRGAVDWNETKAEVSVWCRDKHFVFRIGSHTASVDNQNLVLDVAPYIYQNRTYIPLRFLAEQLSARVEWNASAREVSVHFATQKDRVFAYYYYHSFDEFKHNAESITDVALRWFETNAEGDLFYEYQDDYEQILQFAREKSIKTHASVVFMDKDGLHALLSDSVKRKYLIAQLLEEVKRNNYDGVNIDFEFLGQADRDSFVQFLRDLKQGLGRDKELSVALFACTKPQSWLAGYDYAAIGGIADQVVVMAYDYHYKTSPAGPVAPLWWVEDVVSYLKTIIPAEKLLLGLPTYGYDWGEGIDGTTITAAKLYSLQGKYKLTESFDKASMSPSYSYIDNNGVRHQIWLENKASLQAKLQVAQEYKLAGVSFWRIGNGFTELYELLEEWQ
ncbi:MAG TPA: glycosyl hydrolase family 18 protein [Syntrophomonas sp.]|nr:glycosyl hydrolase family 18 protein [Syntrophomonas sp.]